MKYRAIKGTYGDYGMKHPGEVFEVPDWLVKQMERLEARGTVQRIVTRPPRPQYTVTVKDKPKP